MANYDRYNNFSIPEVNFTASVFKPQELKFEAPNPEILSRSLAQHEERVNRSRNDLQAFDTTIQTLGKDLSPDSGTQEWWINKTTGIRNKIEEASIYGDYDMAIKIAKDEAGKLLHDPEYVARKNSYNAYKTKMDALESSGKYNATDLARYKRMNPYEFKAITDDNGVITGFEEFKPNVSFNPYTNGELVQEINIVDKILSPAINIVSEHREATSNTRQNKTSTSTTNSKRGGSSSSSGTQKGSSRTISEKDIPRLRQEMINLCHLPENYGALYNNFMRDYDNLAIYREELAKAEANGNPDEITRAKNNLASLEKYAGQTGNFVDFDKYIYELCNRHAINAAYHNTENTTSEAVESSNSTIANPEDDSGSRSGKGSGDATIINNYIGQDIAGGLIDSKPGEIPVEQNIPASDRGKYIQAAPKNYGTNILWGN